MLKEYLTSIADSIRAKLGTSEKINAQSYADKISEVYDVGYAKGAEEGGGGGINPEWTDWRYFSYMNSRNSLVANLKYNDTKNGTTFESMLYMCDSLTEIPPIDVSSGTSFMNMFYNCSAITALPELNTSRGKSFKTTFRGCTSLQYISGSLDTRSSTNFNGAFHTCRALIEISLTDTSKGTDFGAMCYNCDKLETISKLNLTSMTNTKMVNMFYNCTALTNVVFEGTLPITTNITVFSQSPKLTVDSLMSFINALTNTGTATYTVTIGSTNLAKLTDEQKAIATAKNINLA